MMKSIYTCFLFLLYMSFLTSCTKETPVIKESLEVQVIDTVVVQDTLENITLKQDTFKIFKLVARNNPLYIDDAFITSLNHDDLKNSNTGDRYRLTVRAFFAAIVGESSWDNRTLMRFHDVDFLSDQAQIDSCFLQLHVFYQDGCSSNDCRPLGDNLISIHPVDADWKEHEVTWTNQPSYNSSIEIQTTEQVTPSDTSMRIDVTSLVQYWVNNNNYGLLIKMTNEDSAERVVEFYSSDYVDEQLRPQLTIYYHEE